MPQGLLELLGPLRLSTSQAIAGLGAGGEGNDITNSATKAELVDLASSLEQFTAEIRAAAAACPGASAAGSTEPPAKRSKRAVETSDGAGAAGRAADDEGVCGVQQQHTPQQQGQAVPHAAKPVLPDVLRMLPLTDVLQYLWGNLDVNDQNALRCSCRAMQQLAQEGLVTSVQLDAYQAYKEAVPGLRDANSSAIEHKSYAEGIKTQSLTHLHWCATHYKALTAVQVVDCPLNITACSLLKAALQAAPKLQHLTLRCPLLGLPGMVHLLDFDSLDDAAMDAFYVAERAENAKWDFTALGTALSAAPQLTTLALRGLESMHCDLAAALAGALCRLPNLIELQLTARGDTIKCSSEDDEGRPDAGVALMASIAALPRLEKLTLSMQHMGPMRSADVAALFSSPSALPCLKELQLEGLARIGGDPGVYQTLACGLIQGAAPKLQVLEIQEFWDDESLESVVRVLCEEGVWQALRSLVKLHMDIDKLSCKEFLQFACTAKDAMLQLTLLRLSTIVVTDDESAVQVAEALCGLSQLEEVAIQFAGAVSRVGVRTVLDGLVGCAPCHKLRKLRSVTFRMRAQLVAECGGESVLVRAWQSAPHLAGVVVFSILPVIW